jgi:hypothetical protein
MIPPWASADPPYSSRVPWPQISPTIYAHSTYELGDEALRPSPRPLTPGCETAKPSAGNGGALLEPDSLVVGGYVAICKGYFALICHSSGPPASLVIPVPRMEGEDQPSEPCRSASNQPNVHCRSVEHVSPTIERENIY